MLLSATVVCQDLELLAVRPRHSNRWQLPCPAPKLRARDAAATAMITCVFPSALEREAQEQAGTLSSQHPAPGDGLLQWLVSERGALPLQPVRQHILMLGFVPMWPVFRR